MKKFLILAALLLMPIFARADFYISVNSSTAVNVAATYPAGAWITCVDSATAPTLSFATTNVASGNTTNLGPGQSFTWWAGPGLSFQPSQVVGTIKLASGGPETFRCITASYPGQMRIGSTDLIGAILPTSIAPNPTNNYVPQYNSSTNSVSWAAESGSGTVSGQTNGYIPLATGPTAIGAPSHLDDGVTNTGSVSSSEGIVTPATILQVGVPQMTGNSGKIYGYGANSTNVAANIGFSMTGCDYTATFCTQLYFDPLSDQVCFVDTANGQSGACPAGAPTINNATNSIGATVLDLTPVAGPTPTASGTMQYDSTTNLFFDGANSATFHTPKVQTVAIAPGANSTYDCLSAVAVTGCTNIGSATETAFATSYTIPAGEIVTGKRLHIHLDFDTLEATAGTTVTMHIRLTNASGTVVASFGPSSTLSGTRGGVIDFYLVGTAAAGSSTTITVNASGALNGGILADSTAAAVGSVNTSNAIIIVPTASFAAATSTNSIELLGIEATYD